MEKIYKGRIVKTSNAEEKDLLGLEDQKTFDRIIIAEELEGCINCYGKYLSVKYYTSKIEVNDPPSEFIKSFYGIGEADYGMHYSDYTGYLWTDEDFNVGGHDLRKELMSHLGEYLYMIINFNKNPK